MLKSIYSLTMQAAEAVAAVRPYLSASQMAIIAIAMRGEEQAFFMETMVDLAVQIGAMPQTFEQDGLGHLSIAFLHYFTGGSDWYITEKDVLDGVSQAYGYAILNSDLQNAEYGVISIEELTAEGAELDLHFKSCSMAEIIARRA